MGVYCQRICCDAKVGERGERAPNVCIRNGDVVGALGNPAWAMDRNRVGNLDESSGLLVPGKTRGVDYRGSGIDSSEVQEVDTSINAQDRFC